MHPPKILQFGGGNFLRGFFNPMIHRLNTEAKFSAGVVLVKNTPKGNYEPLRKQDGLFHVVRQGIVEGKQIQKAELVSCIQEIIHPFQEWEAFLDTATYSEIRFIVSNTTESGIVYHAEDSLENLPQGAFPARLCAWLYRRWQHFEGAPDKGCYLLPCELIEQNGQELFTCVQAYANHWQLEKVFCNWLEQHCFFCNTLVDQIVTGYPTDAAEQYFPKLGFSDQKLCCAEPYHLWVIHGPHSLQSALPLHQVGFNVVHTDQIQAYRQIKVRILNGAHTFMVPMGYLNGLESVRKAIESKDLGPLMLKSIREEIFPGLDFPDDELEAYLQSVVERFKNPFIHHRLMDISLNSINKFRTRLLPSLLAYYEQTEKWPKGILRAFAALICFYRGQRGAEKIALRDEANVLEFFSDRWQEWELGQVKIVGLVQAILGRERFWGQDLNRYEGLGESLVLTLKGYMEDLGWT